MQIRWLAAPVALVALLTGCATIPSGPSVMVLPGDAKSFEQFQTDDGVCRNWSAQQIGITPNQAATHSVATGTLLGTLGGAAAGAAIGAAAGNPALGAAVGAGAGALFGSSIGFGQAWGSGLSVQNRYDISYMQCMYTKGNAIPVARGTQTTTTYPATRTAMPQNIPPPPPGAPPPPPPSH